MNLTWHIIKKDLRLMRWALLVWAAVGAYAWWASTSEALRLQLSVVGPLSAVAFLVLSIATVGRLVQEDSPVDANVDWRTRPISGGRLLAAKVAVLLGIFVLLPTLRLVSLRFGAVGGVDWSTVWPGMTVALASMLFVATLAASTRTLTAFFLLLFGCYLGFMFVNIGQLESVRAERVLERTVRDEWSALRTWIGCGWVILASAVALNAYYRQRRWILGISAVVVAVVGFCAVQIFVRPPVPPGTSKQMQKATTRSASQTDTPVSR